MEDEMREPPKTKVFISWSGSRSSNIAKVWHELLKDMFERVEPFMSSTDIDAGARGFDDIKAKLDGSSFCIAIVTKETENAPWINFEAGALSKQVSNAHVRIVPCLVGYENEGDLLGPLKQFQAKMLDRDGIIDILKALSKVVPIDWSDKAKHFDRLWDEYDEKFQIAQKVSNSQPAGRREKDMLKEVVSLTRDINEQVATLVANSNENRAAFHKVEYVYEKCRISLKKHLAEKYDPVPRLPRIAATTLQLFILATEENYENHGEFLDELSDKYDARIMIIQEVI
uniref:toll/interleukin-1 receptor domain-containing protein n=1 Tax=Rhodococcus qingshengii TaxID=334542 RepID=UPI001C4DDA3A|nr:toll/interleukin-1 receptor domain-containing protein [Rhodococcus qingshengii]